MSLIAQPLRAQYTGKVAPSKAEAAPLRAVAVLEWTGEEGKPAKSRLVPVCILDQGKLQDASLYLARPLPLALSGGTEYELQRNGRPFGLFDLQRAGQDRGSWIGYGLWKAPPVAKPKENLTEVARTISDEDDEANDKPVLHRKRHPEDEKSSGPSSGPSAGQTVPANSSTPAADDPDRPTLRRKSSASSDESAPAADPDNPTLRRKSSASSDESAPAADPDKPTLRRKSQSAEQPAASVDPDRPTLKKSKPAEPQLESEAPASFTDPDRPRLKRGKVESDAVALPPSLIGLPAGMQQAVAVSDAQSRPDHPWEYAWADPDDELKMKAALEQIARQALGLLPPPPLPAPKLPARAQRPAVRKPPSSVPLPPVAPAPLADEQFRVFELAYGSGATLVLSAHTEGSLPEQKFVTLIAQPDLYGKPLVLFKAVTDSAHLDQKPLLRLVDAVDALADNRGELLFELRGLNQRQFALFRVLRGQAEEIFVGGGAEFGSAAN